MSNLAKFFTVLAIFALLGNGLWVLAQEEPISQETILTKVNEMVDLDEDIEAEDLEVGDPTILPDSPFYFLKNWRRGIQSFFTFSQVKKAELKLKFASEKLIEAKKMIVKGVSEEEVLGALEGYKNEIETAREYIEQRKPDIEDPKVERFFEKLIDRNFKHQKLLDRIEEKLSSDVYEKVKEVKEKALENFASTTLEIASAEKLREKIEKITDEQEGSKLKHIKNLEVLMRIEEKVPEQAKEAIRKAQANCLKRLKDNLEAIPEVEKPILEEYMERIAGNETRHFEIISELEATEISLKVQGMVEKSKEKVLERVEERIKVFKTEEQKGKYLEHLRSGEIKNLGVIKELEENLPPEANRKLLEIKREAQNTFRERIEGIESLEAKEKILEQIEAVPSIGTFEALEEIGKVISPEKQGLLNEMKERVRERTREEVEK